MNNKPMSNVSSDMTRSAVPGSVKYTKMADANVMIVAMRNQARPASGFIGLHQVASYVAAPVGFLQRWYNFFTYFARKEWTAGMECTTRW